MKLQTRDNQNDTLAMLKMWRYKKHKEIDEEYDRQVQEFNAKMLKQDERVSQIIVKIEGLVNEGEASYEQVKQLKREIEIMENQVNQLMRNEQIQIPSENAAAESELVNTYVQFGSQKVLIKGRVFCRGRDLYALESAVSLKVYDGLCQLCGMAHMPLQPNRGFYLTGESLHKYLKSKMKN
jgi:DNA repair exonuclease SbcCD ATPase subunit